MKKQSTEGSIREQIVKEVRILNQCLLQKEELGGEDIAEAMNRLAEVSGFFQQDTSVDTKAIVSKACQNFDPVYARLHDELLAETLYQSFHSAVEDLSPLILLEKAEALTEENVPLKNIPANPDELIWQVAERIYKGGHFEIHSKPLRIRQEIKSLCEVMYPAYKSREELELLLENYPQEKERVLADFDEMVARLENPTPENIAQAAARDRQTFLAAWSKELFQGMQKRLAQTVCFAICADLVLAGFYGKYEWAIRQGISEKAASKERPTKALLKEHAIERLIKTLAKDFIARDGRGPKRKPKQTPDEKEKREFAEKVIKACMRCKVKTAEPVAQIVIPGDASPGAKERKMYYMLDGYGLRFSKLKKEAEDRLRKKGKK